MEKGKGKMENGKGKMDLLNSMSDSTSGYLIIFEF